MREWPGADPRWLRNGPLRHSGLRRRGAAHRIPGEAGLMSAAVMVVDGNKRCGHCRQEKPVEGFSANPRSPSGINSWCRECRAEAARVRKKRDPDWYRRYYAKPENRQRKLDSDRLWRYGISNTRIDEMLTEQGHACAACGERIDRTTLHTDHDRNCCPGRRSCGKCIRGLLCGGCNVGIAMMADSPERLRSAASYLERWTSRV
jgi:hypothetical protein